MNFLARDSDKEIIRMREVKNEQKQVKRNNVAERIPLFCFGGKMSGYSNAATRCRRSSICGSKYLPRYSVLQGLNLLQKHVNGNGNIPLF